ncbi:MSHA biogenesis protein MshP [Vibrio sonorensis]|uniref:MSHA biogenesis protein MshP n=1 Tax=Vibrio sonorensis TaxID=1004316 RepID=UPI0008DB2C97|nr:MSHA biogenesis protein MshP [Vibrio sonorensis]
MSHRRKQNGNLFVVVIFVLVVMGFLASTLNRISWSNTDNLTRELIGTQAWLQAHSANEWVLTQMYPLSTDSNVESYCTSVNGAEVGMPSTVTCQPVEISCTKLDGELEGQQLFKLVSTATCGVGINLVQRSQELWLRE